MPDEQLLDFPFKRDSAIEPSPDLLGLRADGPIHKVRLAHGGHAWLVTRYQEVRTLLNHPEFGTQYPGTELTLSSDNLAAGFMFLKDPPEHTRLRRSVTKAFTARRIAELKVRAESIAGELVAAMLAKGPGVDVCEDYAYPLPIAIISDLLGIPDSERHGFRRWADIVLRPSGNGPEEVGGAFADLQAFAVRLVEAKPDGDDLLSDLASHGPDGLDRIEISAMAMGLVMAGYVTTASAISHGLLRLFANPETLAATAEGRVDFAKLVEELLRLQDEEVGINRVAQSDVEVCGVLIKRGETVIASRSAANRDPAEFADPDVIDLTAARNQHLAFGHGVHHCLGAALARMELEVALRTLLIGIPGLRLAVPFAELEWSAEGMDVCIERLPVTW
ncbi:cytochrome P450 [Amycolatopsis sp. cg5]|uniref:cytochrome P450 n=1 Tax=Amycolatopsis sp. cg5 TaxID=3238802 RepID=UPI0035266157